MRPDAAIQSIFGIPDIKIRRDPSVLLPGIQKPQKNNGTDWIFSS